jgi:hypothetical protein
MIAFRPNQRKIYSKTFFMFRKLNSDRFFWGEKLNGDRVVIAEL